MDIRHKANAILHQILDSREPITSPTRNYIQYLTHANERLYARNVILTEQIDAAIKVLSGRKEQISGKRKSIKGKHILTGKELKDIRAAEKVIEQRKRRCLNEVSSGDADGSIVFSNDVAMGNNH